jgi:mRNA-degrading endonuclease toxin of MazEF toxin-antitoxin module
VTSERPKRGQLYFADLEDIGRKLVLVVSSDEVNAILTQPVVCFATATDRERALHTYVVIDPPEGGVWRRTTILCHALVTVEQWRLAEEPIGSVSTTTMARVDEKLMNVLGLRASASAGDKAGVDETVAGESASERDSAPPA